MKYNVYEWCPGPGATKSSLTFAFCWRVNLLIDNNEFVLGSPMTTHQPSSLLWGKNGAITGPDTSSSLSNETWMLTEEPVWILKKKVEQKFYNSNSSLNF